MWLTIDVLCSLAESFYDIDHGLDLRFSKMNVSIVIGGRHPVLEEAEGFVQMMSILGKTENSCC